MKSTPCVKSLVWATLLFSILGCAETKELQSSRNETSPQQKSSYDYVVLAQKYFSLAIKEQGDTDEYLNGAIEAAQSAIQIDPKSSEANYLLGYCLALKGFTNDNEALIEQGLIYYKKSIELKPSLSYSSSLPPLQYLIAVQILAKDTLQDRDPQKALMLLQEAIRVKPDYADTHLMLSYLYDELSNTNLALQEAKTAVELSPNEAKTQMQLGMAYYRLTSCRNERIVFSSAQKGTEAFKIALRLDPTNPETHEMLAVLYGIIGQYELKLFSINAAIEIQDSANRQHELSLAYLAMGDIDKAEVHCKAGMRSAKNPSTHLKWMAYCHYLKEEYELASERLSECFRLKPPIPAYSALLYYNSQLGCGKKENGKTYLEKFNKAFTGNPWEEALIEYHLGIISEDTLISKAKQKFDLCEAYFYIACQYWHSGDNQKAALWFAKVRETDIYDYSEYYGAKVRLKQLAKR